MSEIDENNYKFKYEDIGNDSRPPAYWAGEHDIGTNLQTESKSFIKRVKYDNRTIKKMENIQAEINSLEEFISLASEIQPLGKNEKHHAFRYYIEKNKYLKEYIDKSKGDPNMAYALIKSELVNYKYKKKNGLIGKESKKAYCVLKYLLLAIFGTSLALIGDSILNSYQEKSFNRSKQYEYNLSKVKHLQDISSSLYNNLKSQRPILAAWEKFPGKLSPKILLKDPKRDIDDIIIKSIALPKGKGKHLTEAAQTVSISLSSYEKCLSNKFSKERSTGSSTTCTDKFDLNGVRLMAIEASNLSI